MLTTTSPTRSAEQQPAQVEAVPAPTEVVAPSVLKKLVKAKHGTPCAYIVGC